MVTFEEVVLRLIEEANNLWVEYVPDEPEKCGDALSNNVTALHLLNQAMALTNRKVNELREKYPKNQFAWNTLMMYSMSWELIPGVHGRVHSFTPFEAEASGNALEASLRRGSGTLFTGEKGQGKTLLTRYITGKLFAPTIYVDCRQAFDAPALAELLCDLTKSVIVLDDPGANAVKFVEDVVTMASKSNTFCIITTTGNTSWNDFPVALKEVQLENPTDFEIWRIRQCFAASFHSSYSDLPPCEEKTRAAIVKSIQKYILDSMALLGKLQTVDRKNPAEVREDRRSARGSRGAKTVRSKVRRRTRTSD